MGTTRPRQHEIDESAMAIFRKTLPPAWVDIKHQKDYAIDYTVKIFEAPQDEPKKASGIEFNVQLKGTTRLRRHKDWISFPIETRDLIYYLDKKRRPVFLVVVDVCSEEVYWEFLQGYALDRLGSRDWRSQKTVTIRLPYCNRLHDIELLGNAVKKADGRMTEIRPGSLHGALHAEVLRLQSKDPRIRITGVHAAIQIAQMSDLTGQIFFEGRPEQVDQAVTDLMNRALTVTPQSHDVNISALGMPGFPNERVDVKAILVSRRELGSARISRVDGSLRSRGSIELQGDYQCAEKDLAFHGTIRSGILELNLSIKDATQLGPARVRISFTIAPWLGKPLCRLDEYDQLRELLIGLDQDCSLRFEFFVRGNRLLEEEIPVSKLDGLIELVGLFDWIDKARAVARHVSTDLRLPNALETAWLEDVEFCHRLFCGEWVPIRGFPPTLQTTCPSASLRQHCERSRVQEGAFCVQSDSILTHRIGDEVVEIGQFELKCEQAMIEPLEVKDSPNLPDHVDVTWGIVPKSDVLIRRLERNT